MKVSIEIPVGLPIKDSEPFLTGLLDIINKPEYDCIRDSIEPALVIEVRQEVDCPRRRFSITLCIITGGGLTNESL